ncbi:hypothetical protein SAMN02787118_106271 [Streptomyces mirabilis]|uniref:Uncharacterized protein n=1 Tax=Streptomyces mirabilis TaxID=68239 RepID=A0A1I2IGB3_9ACTN|nr:hypothetical protein SAMN02787118_106271 [Streptomyces mirabilis]
MLNRLSAEDRKAVARPTAWAVGRAMDAPGRGLRRGMEVGHEDLPRGKRGPALGRCPRAGLFSRVAVVLTA